MISSIIGFFEPHAIAAANAVASAFTSPAKIDDHIHEEPNNGGEWVDPTSKPSKPTIPGPMNMFVQTVVNKPTPAPVDLVQTVVAPTVPIVAVNPPQQSLQVMEPVKPPQLVIQQDVVEPLKKPPHVLVGSGWAPSSNPKKPPIMRLQYKLNVTPQ